MRILQPHLQPLEQAVLLVSTADKVDHVTAEVSGVTFAVHTSHSAIALAMLRLAMIHHVFTNARPHMRHAVMTDAIADMRREWDALEREENPRKETH